MSRILGANWGGQVGLLQMRDLGVWERSGNRLHAGQVAAAVGEVVVRHTAAKNTSNQECDIAPKMRHRPMSRMGLLLLLCALEGGQVGHLHDRLGDNLGSLRSELIVSKAARATR